MRVGGRFGGEGGEDWHWNCARVGIFGGRGIDVHVNFRNDLRGLG